jgi:hypothetical protein
MSIFHEQMEIVNRAPWPLTVRFDGAELTVPVGKSFIPRATWGYALNQNPIMGTQDAYNPNVQGAEYLIGDPNRSEKYPCDPLTKDQIQSQRNKPSRYNYEELMEPKLGKRDKIEVKGRKVSRYDAAEPSMVGTDRND